VVKALEVVRVTLQLQWLWFYYWCFLCWAICKTIEPEIEARKVEITYRMDMIKETTNEAQVDKMRTFFELTTCEKGGHVSLSW